jgi:hypothetical protein
MTNSVDVQILVDELVKKVNELQSQNLLLSAVNRQLQSQVGNLMQSLADISSAAASDVAEDD